MNNHVDVDGDCPLATVPCKYCDIGCKFKVYFENECIIELFVIVNRKLGRQSDLKIIKRNYNLLQQLFKLVRYENEGGTGASERIS